MTGKTPLLLGDHTANDAMTAAAKVSQPAAAEPAAAKVSRHRGSVWSEKEDKIIWENIKYDLKWAKIASELPGRTQSSCRNRFQRMKKNLREHGEAIKKKAKKAKKATEIILKPKARSDFESDEDTVLLLEDSDAVGLPSEDELFADTLPTGDYEIFKLDDLVTTPSVERNYRAWRSTMASGSSGKSDDQLLDIILTTASVLTDGSV